MFSLMIQVDDPFMLAFVIGHTSSLRHCQSSLTLLHSVLGVLLTSVEIFDMK